MKTAKWMMTALLAGALTSGTLYADDDYRGYGQGCKKGEFQGKPFRDSRGGMVMGLLFSLELSDKQKETIEKLMVENRYKMKGFRQGSRGDALKAALTDDGFDKAAYIKTSKERAGQRAEARAEHLEKVMAVLTEAQRKALKEKLDKGDFPRPGFGPRR